MKVNPTKRYLLESYFEIKQLEGTSFLGLDINKSEMDITMKQTAYIENILERFRMETAKISASLMLDLMEINNEKRQEKNE